MRWPSSICQMCQKRLATSRSCGPQHSLDAEAMHRWEGAQAHGPEMHDLLERLLAEAPLSDGDQAEIAILLAKADGLSDRAIELSVWSEEPAL